MNRIKIAWEKTVTACVDGDLREKATSAQLADLAARCHGARHPSYRISENVLLEIPSPTWGHGDILIYLAKQGVLVRRNYVDYWYVDAGIIRAVAEDLYCWTDLWLDIALPQNGRKYRLLDADELGDAVLTGSITTGLLAHALSSIHQLTTAIHEGRFPYQEILEAEEIAKTLRSREE